MKTTVAIRSLVDFHGRSQYCYLPSFDLTPSMVADTLLSELSKYSVPIVRCTKANADSQSHSSSIIDYNKDGVYINCCHHHSSPEALSVLFCDHSFSIAASRNLRLSDIPALFTSSMTSRTPPKGHHLATYDLDITSASS
ncbi:hypothetical protein KY285_022317 [Solanum tuberosum]|nr:hypothetical protein KY289_021025 [Solanum tuberosum]KAH0695220.1 hypothetical protein KY285_022317 [Solanum tuberosum]